MSNAYEKYDYLDNQIVFLSQSINMAPWMPLLSWDSHNLGPGAKWGRVSSGSRLLYPPLHPSSTQAPPLSRRDRGTERKKRGPGGAGGDRDLSGMNPGAAMSRIPPHSGRCKPSPTLKVSTLNFSKSMAAEFSTMMVTWASFRTVIGTTRKMPPGPTSRRLNLALAPWVTEFGGRQRGRWMRTETH